LKNYVKRSSGGKFPFFLKMVGGIVALWLLLISPPVYAGSISGESTTLLRMGKAAGDRTIYPLYEYLTLGMNSELGSGVLSANVGGWGRMDLRDKSAEKNNDGALQYGSILYGGNSNNLLFKAGRQFVAEGVAAERIDGLYFRSDVAAGFGVAAFAGSPVAVQSDFEGGDITYGGRITQGIAKYYTIGVSALRTDFDNSRIREEAGLDLWIHPLQQLDIVGRSSYNSITSSWMEHAYTVTVRPIDILRVSADISRINYRDYLYQVTTSALSLTKGIFNLNEKVLTAGGDIELLVGANVRITADYKDYDYEFAGRANYYGGKVAFSLPDSFAAGLSLHRMDGTDAKLKYDEYRVFATKIIGKADVTADFFTVKYDSPINGIDNTYSAAAAVGYQLAEGIKVSADIDYGRSVDFDRDVRGLVKLTWSFDKEYGTKGGQSEK
jgi:hypothetical protein